MRVNRKKEENKDYKRERKRKSLNNFHCVHVGSRVIHLEGGGEASYI